MEEETDKLIKKINGGARPGAGRPPGSLNKTTLEQKIIQEEFRDRILSNIQELLTAQFNIARGASYLFRIEEEKSSKGTVLSKRHVLVENPDEIREVLDEVEGTGVVNEQYYYITTKTPDNRALDSLIDRVFGRPRQNIGLDGGEEGKAIVTILKYAKGDNITPPVPAKELPDTTVGSV